MTIVTILYMILVFTITTLYCNAKEQLKVFKYYKDKYFQEQEQTEVYRSCLYIAIQDMINNGWYKTENEAFTGLYNRLKHYRFSYKLNKNLLISRMLYNLDRIKFSYDYEQELIEREG